MLWKMLIGLIMQRCEFMSSFKRKNDEEKSKTVSRLKGRLSNANSYSDYADYTLDDHILKDELSFIHEQMLHLYQVPF